jgi:hypothetical protein
MPMINVVIIPSKCKIEHSFEHSRLENLETLETFDTQDIERRPKENVTQDRKFKR